MSGKKVSKKKTKKSVKGKSKKAKVEKGKEFKKVELAFSKKGRTKTRRRIRTERVVTTLIVILAIIAVILVVKRFPFRKPVIGGVPKDVVAIVDGKTITNDELNHDYEFFFFVRGIPESYKMVVSKETVLNQTIDEILLVKEAKRLGLSVSDNEVNTVINRAINISGMPLENISRLFEEHNFSINDLRDFYWKVLLINKLLNKTVDSKINVSDSEIQDFYEKNNLTMNLSTVKDQIKAQIYSQKRYQKYLEFIEGLRKRADIRLFVENIK